MRKLADLTTAKENGDPILKGLTAKIREFVKRVNSARILDAGCGDGYFTRLFCVNDNQVTGMDINKVVGGKNPFKFVLGDITRMPFKSSSFNVIVSFDVVEHLKEKELFYKECRRVLKPGGKLLIGTPNRYRLSFYFLKLLGKEPKFPRKLGISPLYGPIVHTYEYTADELAKILKKNGFIIDKINFIWLGIFYHRFVFGLINPPRAFSKFAHYILVEGRKEP